MIVFPVLIPVQNFLFPGTGRENLKCHGKGRDGKFEACIPGNHGKREFPLTPAVLTVLTVQRLIEATGMTWTYMLGWDWTGWTGISDRPTTIAPLKAVLTISSMYF